MTRTIKVHFDGKVFVPDEPVDLPAGETAEIEVTVTTSPAPADVGPPPPPDPEYPLRNLAEWASTLPIDPASPGDRAAQHDHYLYGTPKREKP
jgi:hypothetical protein